MEPKVVNREVKTITTLKYDDGSTKTTEDFKAYSNDIDLPVFLYGKVKYKDKDGKIDEDKSSYFRETLASVMMNPVKKNPILNQYLNLKLKPKLNLALNLNLTPNLNLKIPNAKPPRETTS